MFFESLSMDAYDSWAALLVAFERVNCPDGSGAFPTAVARAKLEPMQFDPDVGKKLSPIATCAWYLSQIADDKSFIFPVKLVAQHFGLEVRTASNVVRALVDRGVLKVTDGEWSYQEGKAREFEFVGKPVGAQT